jgi:hypothetical protein
VSFEAANGVAVGLALGLLAGDAVARLGLAAGARDGMRWMAALIWRLPARSRRHLAPWRHEPEYWAVPEEGSAPENQPSSFTELLDSL